MEFDNIETIKQAVEIGAGVSILPEPTVREASRSGRLGDRAADCPGVAPAAGHHPPPAEGVHAHRGQVRRTLATGASQRTTEESVHARNGSPGHVPVAGKDRLRSARGPSCWRRPPWPTWCLDSPCGGEGRLRQVPRGGRRRRRRAHARRTELLLRRGAAGGLPAGVSMRRSRAR